MSGAKQAGAEKEPKFKLFRKTRGGVALTKEEVKEIKAGRKKLRKEMKAKGVYTKYEFETTASALGLYFDKRGVPLLLWLFHGKGLWALLGASALLIASLLIMSFVSQMRGYFTINISEHMFRHGFVLSETVDFARPSTNLFAEPAIDVPCISIASMGADVDNYDGQHNGYGYFAYTYYIRNEGDTAVDYEWVLRLDGESQNISVATWVMLIEDGDMQLFAEARPDGSLQTIPGVEETSRGFLDVPVISLAKDPSRFLKPIRTVGDRTYYRVEALPFENNHVVSRGTQNRVEPGDVHKYTVVIWLEGDDPDCTDDLIGGHLGLNMQFILLEDEEGSPTLWESIWENLKFWED